MAKLKQFPLASLALLLVSYAGFGWYLSGFTIHPAWARSACYQVFGKPANLPTPTATLRESETAPPLETTKPRPSSQRPVSEDKRNQPKPSSASHPCRIIIEHNLMIGLMAVAWILVSTTAFISPLQNFSHFITRWFRSDTVAFASVFMIAGLAALVLFWLHIFLQILTILAADALARIDIQAAGLTGIQAFWILVLVSLTGLTTGWLANGVL